MVHCLELLKYKAFRLKQRFVYVKWAKFFGAEVGIRKVWAKFSPPIGGAAYYAGVGPKKLVGAGWVKQKRRSICVLRYARYVISCGWPLWRLYSWYAMLRRVKIACIRSCCVSEINTCPKLGPVIICTN